MEKVVLTTLNAIKAFDDDDDALLLCLLFTGTWFWEFVELRMDFRCVCLQIIRDTAGVPDVLTKLEGSVTPIDAEPITEYES